MSFSAPTNYTVGNSPRAVAIGNVNGDSDPDLVVASQGNDKITVLLGGTGGTFTVQPDLTACGTPNSLAVADFNGDSDADIAAVNETCNNVSVWIGGSGSSFGARTDFPVGNLPDRITTGDLNGDSRTDIAVANQLSDNISLLLGLGTGSFMPQLNFNAADGPTGVAIGQFNADGRSDLAVTNEISNNLSVFLGVQDGYARPKGATPLTFRLVPAFLACTSANATHGPPLAEASCSPPTQASSYLTLNAPDRPAPFTAAASSTGLLTMNVFCTDGAPSPCTAAAGDQIDVKLDSTITDVRCTRAIHAALGAGVGPFRGCQCVNCQAPGTVCLDRQCGSVVLDICTKRRSSRRGQRVGSAAGNAEAHKSRDGKGGIGRHGAGGDCGARRLCRNLRACRQRQRCEHRHCDCVSQVLRLAVAVRSHRPDVPPCGWGLIPEHHRASVRRPPGRILPGHRSGQTFRGPA